MSTNPYDRIEKNLIDGSAERVLYTRAIYNYGSETTPAFFHRFVVLEVIFDPTTVDAKKRDYYSNTYGINNIKLAMQLPRNAIIAKRVLYGNSSMSQPAMFLFPMLPPNISLPVQAGEHVWVMFEDPANSQNDIGYWVCRIVEPGFVEDVNHTHSPRTYEPSFNPGTKDLANGAKAVYEFRNGRPGIRDGERYSIAESITIDDSAEAYEKLMKETEAGKLMQYEPVPRYRKRPGEFALEGSNNSLIVLGRDRTGAVAKYKDGGELGTQVVENYPASDTPISKKGAGSIDLVVGRGQTEKTSGKTVTSQGVVTKANLYEELGKSRDELVENEGDPDLKNDRSRVLISQKTKPDKNFQIDIALSGHAKIEQIKDSDDGNGAVVIKTDKARIIARQDIVFLVGNSKNSDKDANGNIKEPNFDPDKCASITIKSNGDIVFTPSSDGIIRLGGEDATLSPLCTRVGRSAGMKGPLAPPPPIIDTMGGSQGAADGLNGTFPTRILMK
jgi:hypothetical protein